MTDFICEDYPKHKTWFYQKHLPETLKPDSGRDIIFAYDNEGNHYGTSFVKKDENEIINYFKNVENCFSLSLTNIIAFDKPISLKEIRKLDPNIKFPQYYACYNSTSAIAKLIRERSVKNKERNKKCNEI